MSSVSAKKVFISVDSEAEQQENIKNQRNALKVLQSVATDKENLAGRPKVDKISRLKNITDVALASTELAKRKKIENRDAGTQTSPKKDTNVKTIGVEDLTSVAKPSAYYFERLAEKRREALEETLVENKRLLDRIEGLEEELNTSRQMLEEAQNLVEVLTEMLNENEAEQDVENVAESGLKPLDDDDSETRSSTEQTAGDIKEANLKK